MYGPERIGKERDPERRARRGEGATSIGKL